MCKSPARRRHYKGYAIRVMSLVRGDGLARAFAEYRRADADFRRALFDRDIKIVAHAHGKNREFASQAAADGIAQFAQFAKVRASALGIFDEGWNGHEPDQVEVREGRNAFRQRGKISLSRSALCGFIAEMNFDQDGQVFPFSGGSGVKFLGERKIIHRIDAAEKICRAASFVALEMTDQVPSGVEVGEGALLRFPLLHTVFAEVAEARVVSRTNDFDGKRFRDSH